MKKLLTTLLSLYFFNPLISQFQLDVQGLGNSLATVANIKVNYEGAEDIIGLSVFSAPNNTNGTGGSFYGGFRGLVVGSNAGPGLFAGSQADVGAFLKGPVAALELGGSDTPYGGGEDDCVIRTERGADGGDLILVSNDEIVLHLNDDNNVDAGHFAVLNSDNNEVLNLNESGNLDINQISFKGFASTYSSTADPDDGVIKAPDAGGSDLFLVSNDDVAIHLDDNSGSSGLFQVYSGANAAILTLNESGNLSVNGKIELGVLGTAGGVSVCLNSAGELAGCSSSLRYKSDIQSFQSGYDLLSQLRPVTFQWKDSGQKDLGLIAEEVAQINPLLTTTNEQGQVEGVKYDRIGIILINVVKDQQQAIEELKEENDQLKNMIGDILKRMDQMTNK